MKLINNILIIALIYLICSARTSTDEDSTAERDKEAALYELRDSIKQVFEVNFPDDELLKALEETAKEKLIDFSDYLRLVSDSSLDARFRQQAAEMAVRLFISKDINVRKWSKTYPVHDLKTLEYFLNESLFNGMPYWIQSFQIEVKRPLTWKNDTTFTGTLSFYQQIIPFDNQTPPVNLPAIKVIDIYALKKIKSFGQEHLSIWEVYLGDVK